MPNSILCKHNDLPKSGTKTIVYIIIHYLVNNNEYSWD